VTNQEGKQVVLIVDDDDSVRKVIMRALDTFGFATVGAVDGNQAVETFTAQRDAIDCIIVDMSMPGMDGEQTFLALREVGPTPPVLLASGHSAEEMQERYGGAGFAGYLQKPFQITSLADVVRNAISTSR
jgi:two-component system, cell cycle sensor histidine kinase and response regulator CckA